MFKNRNNFSVKNRNDNARYRLKKLQTITFYGQSDHADLLDLVKE